MILSVPNALREITNIIKTYDSELPLIIAIDGRAASGKTTFAEKLNVPVIHTDDFFRPRDNRGELALTEFDGNFDIERFKSEVVANLKTGNSFEYGMFDCFQGKITASVRIPLSACYVVEGAYSINPVLGDYAGLKVFFDVSKNDQKQRIINRGGEEAYNRFRDIWIPAEERYLAHYNIQAQCDITVFSEV